MDQYSRIAPFPVDFSDRDAVAVEALGDVWRERVQELRNSEELERFNEELYRRWAIETGILERLYSIDRGITEVLVQRGLDVSLIEHGSTDRPPEEVVPILRDHREAVQYVMDFVAGNNDLSLHFIRSVHQILTAHQHAVEGVDQFGQPVTLELLKGDWKKLPNNPTRPDGSLHLYCPPHLVQEEMENLVRYFQIASQQDYPTTALSAWLHHRFTQIHPFQDGNGRVARALAAFVFVKRRFFPVVIERDDRSQYIECLEEADSGNLYPLVALWNRLQRKSVESALSLSETVLGAEIGGPANLLRAKLLEAITDRARKRSEALRAKQKHVLVTGDKIYAEVVQNSLDGLRRELDASLKQVDPNFNCVLEHSTLESAHWFKMQLVEVASKYDYYCDLNTYHRWSRLKIRHRDVSDDQTAEIVVSLHSLGRTFSGVLAISGYFAERDLDDGGRRVSSPPLLIAERPVSFTYAEAFDNIRARCVAWLDLALNVSLEEFRKTL
jgi:Fic family protein